MNRRQFLKVAAAGLVATQLSAAPEPKGMQHLYSNYEGETVAANTLEEAAHFHDCEMGGRAEPEPGWCQIPDHQILEIIEWDEPGQPSEVMTAREWAEGCSEPTQVATTYT